MFLPISPAPPAPADFKKSLQRGRERFGGVEPQSVHAGADERAVQFRQPFRVDGGETLANGVAVGIQFQQFAGFGVLNREQAGVRQRAFARVMQVQADDIVPRVRKAKFGDDIACGSGTGVSPVRFDSSTAPLTLSHSSTGETACATTPAVQKIRQQKNHRAAVQNVVQKSERDGNIRAATARLEHQHFADEAEQMAAAFARREQIIPLHR